MLARVYGLSPADVYALSVFEFEAFVEDLEGLSGS